MLAVKAEGISKIYTLKDQSHMKTRFYALKQVSFEIQQGDVVGILGTNGSGKSTLSLLLAGISEVNEGKLMIEGEPALVAINAGLNAQLTGRENIRAKGALMGFKKKQIEQMMDEVIDFAELGQFMDQPVKKYSSGMKSRLGFAISLALDPDIFIVDEALSVGDKGFAKKCMNRMMTLRDTQNKTIFFISHSLAQVQSFCKTGLWIEGGTLKALGPIDEVSQAYAQYVDELDALSKKEKKAFLEAKFNERVLDRKKGWFR